MNRDQIIEEMNTLKDRMETVHILRGQTVDLRLEGEYTKMLRQYTDYAWLLGKLEPSTVSSFGNNCLKEAGEVWIKIEALDSLVQQYDDDILHEELSYCIGRHIRLLDQANVMLNTKEV